MAPTIQRSTAPHRCRESVACAVLNALPPGSWSAVANKNRCQWDPTAPPSAGILDREVRRTVRQTNIGPWTMSEKSTQRRGGCFRQPCPDCEQSYGAPATANQVAALRRCHTVPGVLPTGCPSAADLLPPAKTMALQKGPSSLSGRRRRRRNCRRVRPCGARSRVKSQGAADAIFDICRSQRPTRCQAYLQASHRSSIGTALMSRRKATVIMPRLRLWHSPCSSCL